MMPLRSTSRTAETTDDSVLMQHCRDGDLEAFRLLVERHQEKLVNFFGRMGVHNEKEDLAQETFLKIFRSRHRYRKRAKFTTFLYIVARNVYFDYVRKTGRRQSALHALTSERKISDEAIASKSLRSDHRHDVEAALDGLSPKLRMVVVLAFFEGQDYRTISRILKVPMGTVKSRMHLAMNQLRHFFKD